MIYEFYRRVCVAQRGGQMSSRERAAAGGPGGRVPGPRRLRADRPGARKVAGGPTVRVREVDFVSI